MSFIKKLKEKKKINEGSLDKNTMDLSELRESFWRRPKLKLKNSPMREVGSGE
jgi:hypothetical protein